MSCRSWHTVPSPGELVAAAGEKTMSRRQRKGRCHRVLAALAFCRMFVSTSKHVFTYSESSQKMGSSTVPLFHISILKLTIDSTYLCQRGVVAATLRNVLAEENKELHRRIKIQFSSCLFASPKRSPQTYPLSKSWTELSTPRMLRRSERERERAVCFKCWV